MKNVAFEQWLLEEEEEEKVKLQRERMAAAAANGHTTAGTAATTTPATTTTSTSMRPSLLREAQLTNPVSLLSALLLSDLLELQTDLTHVLQLNEQMEYWRAIATLCDEEIVRCKGERTNSGVTSEVMRDISARMRDKSTTELRSLSVQVEHALQEGADTAYWRAVSAQLAVQQAKAHLRESHAEMLRRRLELLKEERRRRDAQQQRLPAQQMQRGEEARMAASISSAGTGSGSSTSRPTLEVDTLSAQMSSDAAGGIVEASGEDSNTDHHLSPRLFSFDEQLDVSVIEASDDLRSIAQQRTAVLAQYQPHTTMHQLHPPSADSAAPRSVDASHGSEYAISNEVSLPVSSQSWSSSQLSWSSKWRPRKPRYFNRVKTGFDWNKYNQVHYDKDNPPPKLVQGYKFNIFYPDLLDATRTPTYRMQPLEGDEQGAYCILRFQAGPPYEDVAFKIVRKEWEFGPRRGFRCTFDKGVLQLHFNFKRYFYRR